MIDVAAAIIYDEQGRMLICRRMDAGDCAGLWELPGGKREHGESMAQCLVRECREELGVVLDIGTLYEEFVYSYPAKTIHFCFYKASIASGQVSINVHSEVKWVLPSQLAAYHFCPADEKLVERLASEQC